MYSFAIMFAGFGFTCQARASQQMHASRILGFLQRRGCSMTSDVSESRNSHYLASILLMVLPAVRKRRFAGILLQRMNIHSQARSACFSQQPTHPMYVQRRGIRAPRMSSRQQPGVVFNETLYSVTKTGAAYEWNIQVHSLPGKPQDIGELIVTRGQVDGKKTTSKKRIEKGTNIGKKNEKTPVEQAVSQAESKRNKKLDSGYDYTLDGSKTKYDEHLKPMLALLYERQKGKLIYPIYGQPKLDGIRCLARKSSGVVTLFSRQGKVLDLVPHINEALSGLLQEGDSTDGELYVHSWDFQRIVSAIKKRSEDTPLIQYHIYDFPDLQNRDQLFLDRFSESKQQSIRDAADSLLCVETVLLDSEQDLLAFEEKAIERGYEGVMARNRESKYLFGYRSMDLLKVKRFLDDEYRIVGVEEGTAVEAGCAVFVCITPAGQKFGVRPTGTHEERRVIFNNAGDYVGKTLTVKFQQLSQDGVPRFPVGLHIREDWD